MTVKERLIAYLEYEKISKSEFGRTIGVSNAYISSMRKSIQPDKIQSISLNYPNLNTEWLLTGKGEMLKNDSNITKNTKNINMKALETLEENVKLLKENNALLKQVMELNNRVKLLEDALRDSGKDHQGEMVI